MVVMDKRGFILARLCYNGSEYQIIRSSCCSLGTFFYILSFLKDKGINFKA